MTGDHCGHLPSDDLAGVAEPSGEVIESVAVAPRHSGSEYDEAGKIVAAS